MNNLTHEELETLAQAYLDCRLTRLEEKELELVLYSSDISSPVIDEARRTMGIITLLSGGTARLRRSHVPRRRFTWLGWAAAAVGILLLSSLLYFPKMNVDGWGGTGDNMAVYVNGRHLTGDEAMMEALQAQDESRKMVRELCVEVKEDYNSNMKLIN
ncbi:MAG: hypothetical protein HDS55_05560 [Barnesiella sp.]|nr:hypothetical protein [Barnesiella sp.]